MTIGNFLKQRAVDIVVGGTYVLPNWYDQHGKLRRFACRTTRVSPFKMLVDVPVVGRVGDTISSYFADFGKLTGRLSDAEAGRFMVDLEMDGAQRARMNEQLTWLERKQKDPTVKDARTDARIIPVAAHSTVTTADGRVHRCFVIDVSVSGVAVSADLQPPVGTALAVGACVGRVVRTLPHGFAVQFAERQKKEALERLIGRQASQAMLEDLPESTPAAVAEAEKGGNVTFIEI